MFIFQYMNNLTLAQFIQQKRDKLGMSAKGLAMKSNLDLSLVEDIESEFDGRREIVEEDLLFLSTDYPMQCPLEWC